MIGRPLFMYLNAFFLNFFFFYHFFPLLRFLGFTVDRRAFTGQGEDDKFLPDQLLPHKFEAACKKVNAPLILRMQPGYDHSYFFISTFIDDHICHHAQALNASKL